MGNLASSNLVKSLDDAKKFQELVNPARGGRTCALCGLDHRAENIVLGALACVCRECCSTAFAIYHEWSLVPALSYREAYKAASAKVSMVYTLDPIHEKKYKQQHSYYQEMRND